MIAQVPAVRKPPAQDHPTLRQSRAQAASWRVLGHRRAESWVSRDAGRSARRWRPLESGASRHAPSAWDAPAQDHPTLRQSRAQAESRRVLSGLRTGGIVGLTRRRPAKTVATPRIGDGPSRAVSVDVPCPGRPAVPRDGPRVAASRPGAQRAAGRRRADGRPCEQGVTRKPVLGAATCRSKNPAWRTAQSGRMRARSNAAAEPSAGAPGVCAIERPGLLEVGWTAIGAAGDDCRANPSLPTVNIKYCKQAAYADRNTRVALQTCPNR